MTPQILKNNYQHNSLGILESSLACFFLLDNNQCPGEITVIKQLDILWKIALHVIIELWWKNSLSVLIHSVSSPIKLMFIFNEKKELEMVNVFK